MGYWLQIQIEWLDGLERLVLQPDLRYALGQAARRVVEERYSLTARASDLAVVLKQVEADRWLGLRRVTNEARRLYQETQKIAKSDGIKTLMYETVKYLKWQRLKLH